MSRARPVDRLERFEVGGAATRAPVRGADRRLPVLLLVQAGPGLPMIHEARAFEGRLRLEERFRVVYWDQPGTGLSHLAGDAREVTLASLVAGVREMATAVCARLEVPTLHVLGFSLGATLALLAAAEDASAMSALTCVGPDVDLLAAERFAWAFALEAAERRGARRSLRALARIGAPPHADGARFGARVKVVADLGGVHRGRTYAGLVRDTLWRLWTSPHYGARARLRALRAMTGTQARVVPALQGLDLLGAPLRIPVPVAIFQGRHDKAAPPALSAALAARLGAELWWFEESAHMPHEEQPRAFRAALLRFVDSVSVC